MKIICSWCKKFMGEKEPFDDETETHAKCVECLRKQEGEGYVKKNTPVRYITGGID